MKGKVLTVRLVAHDKHGGREVRILSWIPLDVTFAEPGLDARGIKVFAHGDPDDPPVSPELDNNGHVRWKRAIRSLNGYVTEFMKVDTLAELDEGSFTWEVRESVNILGALTFPVGDDPYYMEGRYA